MVFLSGYALKRNSLGLFSQTGNREAKAGELTRSTSPYGFIFFIGLSMGVATTILFNLFPSTLQERLGELLSANGKIILVGLLLLSAVLSWPMSHLINRYGLDRVFWISISVLLLSTMAIFFLTSTVLVLLLALLYTITFTSLSVVSLPLAINRAAFSKKVFCVGVFFSGAALPDAIWQIMQ